MSISGVDTTFLIQYEVREVTGHVAAREYFQDKILASGNVVGIAEQVLLEFLHIVTDEKRFKNPLSIDEAIDRATLWWTAKEVEQIYQKPGVLSLTLQWLKKYKLGRKRLLDTQLAATYHLAGIQTILTSNARDFSIFNCFQIVNPAA